MTLSHRPKDADVVKKAASAAQKRYKDMSGRESKVSFEAKLSDESAGGIVGSTMGGRIRVDDTLEERLKILQEKVSQGTLPSSLFACNLAALALAALAFLVLKR